MVAALPWCAYAAIMPSADLRSGSEAMVTYTVQPGDTLWGYAAHATPVGGDVNDSIDALMKINHLDSVALSVGQQIKVPVDGVRS
ncbi:LysM peptidoglycan-binding domain-containing protein [Bifidobacterium sp. UBA744]|uniref:LysM peptidoglycan-binding domain-containing protein n=1 Tax=Bifidobacterium sp. UBA744 TaxID=1946112 RepID=UPI0025C5D97F|nr:LysM peptidoglycan-binding domain-containing protein [Bifidobacterium sp. UBA744]